MPISNNMPNNMPNTMSHKKVFILFFLIASALLCSCEPANNPDTNSLNLPEGETAARNQSERTSLLETIKSRGKLTVLTSNLPTTYYFDRDNELAGLEYEMTQAFAKSIGVEVKYKIYDSTKAIITALRNNEGDIAAAGLTINHNRQREFDFGPSYQTTKEYLVCHRDKKRIRNIDDLNNIEIVIAAETNYLESIKDYPDMAWITDDEHSTADLIKKVSRKKLECTISDSTLYSIERRFHTEISDKYSFSKDSKLAWMLNKHHDDLKQAISDWFDTYENDYDLAYELEKYYGYVQIFDYVDTHRFLARTKTRLPKYKEYFIDAALKNDIDPSLLAAQSYQESHWNRKAKSPTGVRGIMMLTQPVAKSLGVTNRLHAEQNIYAGAKFQAKMKKMVSHVEEPDRSWLALAAYNVGRGHFRDAQSLARKLNKNPDRWSEMKEVLPLLSQKKYYKDLRYGYARGNEPVRYVTRIRNYDGLLHQHFGKEKFEGVK